jgi:tetratricopeptide (TPR) repeat protein
MKRIVSALLLWLVATMLPSPVAAQRAPDPLTDMQQISRALGVPCSYCHVRAADRTLDYLADHPKKAVAHEMIAMTREINARILAASGKAADQTTRIDCLTCHRGTPLPARLGDIIRRTLRDGGVDAAVAKYRELRAKYFGRDVYDFSENDLLTLGQRLAESSRADDAIVLMTMNLEFNPKSARSYIVLARAYTRKRDRDMAIQQLKKSLELDPNNPLAKGYLYNLEHDRR